jgi:putative SOS response-associated peptidase YedK
MCNDYEQHILWAEYCEMMQKLKLGIPTQQTEIDLPRSDDIKINDLGPVIRIAGNGVELVPMNFSFPPSGPRDGPVFNFRSEGRSFAKSNRCLIPASAFFEFTGNKYPKAKHRFTLEDGPFLAIAGIWREGKDGKPPAFTMLTTEPGPDVQPYHDRQIVVLWPADWVSWLDLTKPEGELLRPTACWFAQGGNCGRGQRLMVVGELTSWPFGPKRKATRRVVLQRDRSSDRRRIERTEYRHSDRDDAVQKARRSARSWCGREHARRLP